jgi:CO dehydrogenase nickel-insertion accessory protein CooC1
MTRVNGDGNSGTSVHISLQGKGGVGKSFIASILTQYFLSRGQHVNAIDADPVNQTLAEYGGLSVSRLNLLKEGSVDQREFDLLMERFLT